MLLELKLDPNGWFKQVFKTILTRNLVQSTIGKTNPFWTNILFNSSEMAYSNGDLSMSWHVHLMSPVSASRIFFSFSQSGDHR
jgi:hypothetical protein